MTLKQSQSAEPAANDGAVMRATESVDSEMQTAAESAEDESSASSGRMATFYRDRLFGRMYEIIMSADFRIDL